GSVRFAVSIVAMGGASSDRPASGLSTRGSGGGLGVCLGIRDGARTGGGIKSAVCGAVLGGAGKAGAIKRKLTRRGACVGAMSRGRHTFDPPSSQISARCASTTSGTASRGRRRVARPTRPGTRVEGTIICKASRVVSILDGRSRFSRVGTRSIAHRRSRLT
ncbi:MAG: hypothetical protein KGI87_06785, partial [Burkholderiales bacterium]|nr:hypothetical protein [Burkholderiales bacterium]